ncbi:carotenoid oxygenase family protein [Novosphingobium sp. RL4]|uniref:carotenoid oxygenase family protein n=1 Tax=Novosphingobium sp. RL4 TaxID=3109595 RepID=UPI002D7863DC|nr:carotenoid oxygenase family protein [Novosphingobium sp. RL4]WRT94951.1 carotenoid oxygenase family protein [Novosphingobium sp. RL4]
MAQFPDTIHFTGLNTPIGIEWSARNLDVIGEIPADIDGAFFRAVPDPAHAPLFGDDIALSGDGMIGKFTIRDGKVDYAIRYVETARYKAEKAARRALFGQYRNPFTDTPEAAGIDRTVANTTPVWHAGRLFMTKEDGLAYEVDPETLETRGRWDYYGALKSETFTAHPRLDPETGELFFFGYEAGGLCSTDVAYCIADRDGKLVSEQWFQQPYCSTIHDFAITERHAVFPIFPTTADLDRLRAGGPHWAHRQDLESWVAIMPRYGKVDEMRWFKGPKGVSAFHLVNAFDDGDLVHLDICLTDTNAFAFMREAGGVHRAHHEIQGGLTRWTFDLTKPGDTFESRVIGPPGDMPRLRDADQGRPYRSAWYLTVNPQGGPPLPGGPVGVAFNMMLRIEPGNGRVDAMPLGPEMAINEPVHVPASAPGKDGWLLTVVDRRTGPDSFASELWIIDGADIAKGPVARVPMPVPMRAQVHGAWVSAEQLAQGKPS